MQRGQLSYSKVRALTRVATADNERSLLDFARCGTAAHVERLVRGWRRVDRVAEARDKRRRHETRELRTWVDADGMVVIRGRLSPEVGAVVQRALEAASERLYKEAAGTDPGASETTAGQRRADALGLLADTALTADLDRGTRRRSVSGRCPRRRGCPGERRGYRPVRVRGRPVRFSGNVAPDRLRRRHGRHASRVRWDRAGRGPKDAHRLAGPTPGAHRPRPPVPLPGLLRPPLRCPSRPPLGPGWFDQPGKPAAALSAAPSCCPRGRIHGHVGQRWCGQLSLARWPATPCIPSAPALERTTARPDERAPRRFRIHN